MTFDISLSFKH